MVTITAPVNCLRMPTAFSLAHYLTVLSELSAPVATYLTTVDHVMTVGGCPMDTAGIGKWACPQLDCHQFLTLPREFLGHHA